MTDQTKTRRSVSNRTSSPASTGADARAAVLWETIRSRYRGVDALPQEDPVRQEILGLAWMRAEGPGDALLTPRDLLGLMISEKKFILQRRFLEPGPFRQRYVDFGVIKKAAVWFSVLLHKGFALSVDPPEGPPPWEFSGLATTALAKYEKWLADDCLPSIEDVRRRGNENPRWGHALMAGEMPPPDRACRIAQLYMGMEYEYNSHQTAEGMETAIKRGFRRHQKHNIGVGENP